MINFKSFLIEQEEEPAGKPLKHLEHTEDRVFDGHEGVGLADNHLREVNNLLQGKKSKVKVSTKWDGAPSIVYGNHPSTGQFFIATKGAFNKKPKLAFSHEDIDQHFGHAPGLAAKMHEAFDHLSKVMPREGGVYQGDLIGVGHEAANKNGMVSQTPNTITYSAPADSAEGRGLQAPFSFVTHTKYTGRGGLENMSAEPLDDKTRAKFASHPDVNHIDPSMDINPTNYTPEERAAFEHHMENARQSYSRMKPEAADALAGHEIGLRTHINDMIRKDGTPSTQGYMDLLTAKHNKRVAGLKSQKAIDKANQEHAAAISHITANQEHFDKALELHNHLQQAKNVLVGVMAKNNPYTHTVDGVATQPEGVVVHDGENATKMNNRQEFNRLNFLKGQFQRSTGNPTPESVNEDYDQATTDPTHHDITWVRANPMHDMHGAVVNQTVNSGDLHGGGHTIYLTRSHDPEKNPLPPERKLYWARKSFPGANIQLASPKAPTILHQLSQLHNDGVKHVHVHVGSDRLDEFQKLLNSYNGVKRPDGSTMPHGYYNFDSINVYPVGETRDDKETGTAGYSASRMRAAAQAGDRETFHMMAPSALTPDEKDQMMSDTWHGMNPPPDQQKPAPKKKLKEETVSSGAGSIGGLGFNSGNPAGTTDYVANYVERNTADADTRDNVLNKWLKDNHTKLHNRLGFKEFSPKNNQKASK